MLIAGYYRFRGPIDARVGLKRFLAWTPPTGFAFQGHWATADGKGGLFVADAETAAAAFEATAVFADIIEFDIVPVVDIAESVPISMRALDWIDSVG